MKVLLLTKKAAQKQPLTEPAGIEPAQPFGCTP